MFSMSRGGAGRNDRGAFDRRRRSGRPPAEVESLERREVLSGLLGYGPAGHAAAPAQVPHGDVGPMHLPGMSPRHAVAHAGIASKSPAFYEFYTGRKDPGLNARRATARVRGNRLVLTGTMQGRIDTRPTDDASSSFYVFGVNRGTGAVIAPFPGRPNVIFDAVVGVSVEPRGISATVTDFTKPPGQGSMILPADAVRVRGHRVSVVVPLGALTPTAAVPVSQWGINLWPRSALPPRGDFHTVASFVPEDAMFPIAVHGRPGHG